MTSNRHPALPLAALFALVTVVGCGAGPREAAVDLDAVLNVTTDSMIEFDLETSDADARDRSVTGASDGASGEDAIDDDDTRALLVGFADVLETNYNAAEPALHPASAIVVAAQDDASFIAVADTDGNGEPDQGEDALWAIEIDGENARIVATDRSGAVQQSGFSGTSLLAGYFLASMLTRQRAAGVDTRALANKRTVSPTQAARARAGSGSFSRGK